MSLPVSTSFVMEGDPSCHMVAVPGLLDHIEVVSLFKFVLPLLTPAAKLETVHEFVFHLALTSSLSPGFVFPRCIKEPGIFSLGSFLIHCNKVIS